MILDNVFNGILDQGAGCLEVFDEPEADVSGDEYSAPLYVLVCGYSRSLQKTYEATLDTIKNMGNVVESLYEKVRSS